MATSVQEGHEGTEGEGRVHVGAWDGLLRDSLQDRQLYMGLALEEARKAAALGEVPVGAVVVHEPYDRATRTFVGEPQVVARAHNLRETAKDASAHAELLAMREAMGSLDAWRLSDCTVYVTLEPCLMCAGLMQQARVAACVFGAYDPKGGALGSLYDLHDDKRLNHSFAAVGGVMEDECSRVLKEFFAGRRARK